MGCAGDRCVAVHTASVDQGGRGAPIRVGVVGGTGAPCGVARLRSHCRSCAASLLESLAATHRGTGHGRAPRGQRSTSANKPNSGVVILILILLVCGVACTAASHRTEPSATFASGARALRAGAQPVARPSLPHTPPPARSIRLVECRASMGRSPAAVGAPCAGLGRVLRYLRPVASRGSRSATPGTP